MTDQPTPAHVAAEIDVEGATAADPTPEQLAAAVRELRKAPDFATFLDRHRPLVEAIIGYTGYVKRTRGMESMPEVQKNTNAARERVNEAAERAGITWR